MKKVFKELIIKYYMSNMAEVDNDNNKSSSTTTTTVNELELVIDDSVDFITEHSDEIENLNKKVADILVSSEINLTGKQITIGQCIKIVGLIKKTISGSIALGKGLSKLSPDDKLAVIFRLIVEILNSNEVQDKLSPEVASQIKDFAADTETINEITNLVDWINGEILDALDKNDDGIVTEKELVDCCVSCCLCKNKRNPEGCSCYQSNGKCNCCMKFSKGCGKFWSCLFLKLFCCNCSSNQIEYDRPKN